MCLCIRGLEYEAPGQPLRQQKEWEVAQQGADALPVVRQERVPRGREDVKRQILMKEISTGSSMPLSLSRAFCSTTHNRRCARRNVSKSMSRRRSSTIVSVQEPLVDR